MLSRVAGVFEKLFSFGVGGNYFFCLIFKISFVFGFCLTFTYNGML